MDSYVLHYIGHGFECDIAIPTTPANVARGCEVWSGSVWRRGK